MNKGLIFTFGLTIGAIGGYFATVRLLQNKYEQLAREEIEEVRAYYASKDDEKDETEETDAETDEHDRMMQIGKALADGYADGAKGLDKHLERRAYSAIASLYSKVNEGGDKPMRCEPYVISPAEFGEDDNYETITLIYYKDGILADQDGNMIQDVESCIGYESLNHFGEYDGADDAVYVRNDDSKIEYEVLLDDSNYSDLEGID